MRNLFFKLFVIVAASLGLIAPAQIAVAGVAPGIAASGGSGVSMSTSHPFTGAGWTVDQDPRPTDLPRHLSPHRAPVRRAGPRLDRLARGDPQFPGVELGGLGNRRCRECPDSGDPYDDRVLLRSPAAG